MKTLVPSDELVQDTHALGYVLPDNLSKLRVDCGVGAAALERWMAAKGYK